MTLVAVRAEADARPLSDPVSDGDFARSIEGLGPFEHGPHLAVALSGGIDSSALMALTQAWATARGDVTLTALIVDHGLRPSSGDEARRTAEYWHACGVEAVILTHHPTNPGHGSEAAARLARWALLEDWCQRHGVLNLLLGHHRDDQAETVLMRLGKASGPVGLAGMAAASHRGQIRVLRPLLTADRAQLAATIKARGIAVVEDPSNADPRYLRNRMRAAAPVLQGIGLSTDVLCDLATAQADIARTMDRQINQLALACLSVDSLGVVTVDHRRLKEVADETLIALLLGRVLTSVGGHRYPVRRTLQDHAARWLARPFETLQPVTLGGCRLATKTRDRRQYVTVTREVDGAQAHGIVPLRARETMLWDGRFRIAAHPEHLDQALAVTAADRAVWSALKPCLPNEMADLPAQCRWGLPALLVAGQPVAVLAPGYLAAQPAIQGIAVRWAPLLPMLRVT